jgi:dolichol-phosphate mannosyltransferase
VPAVVVVIPAFNEAPRIARVVERVPQIAEHVIVVDDASTDTTSNVLRAVRDPRLRVITHAKNRGVGAAIVTGYRAAIALTRAPNDAFVVMAGDGQMDPSDLPALVDPIFRGDAGYVKGARFSSPEISVMPRARYFGGRVFSWLTSRAIDVPITDSQCGYTAIARDASLRIDLEKMWPRFGYPNDLLAQLARAKIKIREVPVRPIYADEESKLRARHTIVIAGLILRAWVRRVSS